MDKGDSIKINLQKLNKNTLEKNTIENIKKFDKEHEGIHKITNIYIKNSDSDNPIKRIELDNKFVFYETELIDSKYTHLIYITDFNLAKYIFSWNDSQLIDRVNDLKFNDDGKLKYISFFINYNSDDEVIKLIYQYNFEKFYNKNSQKLWDKFIQETANTFYKMNYEKFEVEYFNEKYIKNINEEEMESVR